MKYPELGVCQDENPEQPWPKITGLWFCVFCVLSRTCLSRITQNKFLKEKIGLSAYATLPKIVNSKMLFTIFIFFLLEVEILLTSSIGKMLARGWNA